jgi:multiple sugar transport system substrate-binding protein
MLDRITNRRRFLGAIGSAAVGVAALPLIASCSSSPSAAPTQPSASSAQPTAGAAGATSATSGATPTVANQANTAQQKITLRYMDRAGALGEFMRHFSRVYEQRHPNITVKNESASWGDLVTKVATYVAAGTMADLAFQHAALMLPELAAKGVWTEVEPMAKADNLDMTIFYQWALNTCKLGPNNKLVAMPMGVHTGQNNRLMYNVELFQKAGIDPPTDNMSVDDLTQLGVNLKSKLPDVWPILLPLDAWTMEGHARSWKGYLTSEDRTKAGFALPETQAAHHFVYDWINKYKIQPGQQEQQGGQSQLFYNQKLAIAVNCSANIWVGFNDAVKGKFTLGNSIWPSKPSGVIGTVPSADATVVYGKTKYPQESWGLQSLLSSAEASKWAAINPPNMTPGAVISAWHDPDVWKTNPPYEVDAKWWDTLTEVQNIPVPANTRQQEFSDAYGNGWQAMAYNTTPYTDPNVQALQKKLQDIMDKPLP